MIPVVEKKMKTILVMGLVLMSAFDAPLLHYFTAWYAVCRTAGGPCDASKTARVNSNEFGPPIDGCPLVNQHKYGKPPSSMGKLTNFLIDHP